MANPFLEALDRRDFAEATRLRNLRTPYEAGQFGSLLSPETWTESLPTEGMVFQPYLIYPNASKSDLDKAGKVVTYGKNLRQPLRVTSGEGHYLKGTTFQEDPEEEWTRGEVAHYSFTGNWKLDDDARTLLERRVDRALRETGMSVLPMKVLESTEDLATWRENWGPPAERMGVGNLIQQPKNVKPVYLIRGLGAYAGGHPGGPSEIGTGRWSGSFGDYPTGIGSFMTMGDSVIEALAGYEGPTAFEKIQVAAGKDPEEARYMASYQSQMGTVLHESLHQVGAMPHTKDEVMVDWYATDYGGAHGDKFMQAIDESIRGTRPEDSMKALRLVMQESWNYGWGAPGTVPPPIAPVEGGQGGSLASPTAESMTSPAPKEFRTYLPSYDSTSSLSDKLEKESIDGTTRSDVMALVDQFMQQFERNSPYRSTDFWQDAVNDGSISQRETARASVEVRSPRGMTFWVSPGEVPNLRNLGFSIGAAPAPAEDVEGVEEEVRTTPSATGVSRKDKQIEESYWQQVKTGSLSIDELTRLLYSAGANNFDDLPGIISRLKSRLAVQEGVEEEVRTTPSADAEQEGVEDEVRTTPSADAEQASEFREGQIANIEAEVLSRAIRGEFTGAGMDEMGDPLDVVRAALLEAGLSVDEANTSLITLGNNPDWQRVFGAAIPIPVPTAIPVPCAIPVPGDPGDPGAGVTGPPLSGRPQAGRFSQFAKYRQVDPELGGPALRELERQFEPL